MQLVFFDLESSSLDDDADVLQIAARFPNCNYDFGAYMMPTRPISPGATEVNSLTFHSDWLHHKGTPVLTETRSNALKGLYNFLRQSGDRCTMIAHNCSFDRNLLLRMIIEDGSLSAFAQVIDRFTDTLQMFEKKFPERKYQKGRLTLKALATELSLPTEGLHDARHDAWLLEKIALHHFTKVDLITNGITFDEALKTRR